MWDPGGREYIIGRYEKLEFMTIWYEMGVASTTV